VNRVFNIENNETEERPFSDKTLYPLMCMTSTEPIRMKHPFFYNQTFTLNCSVFKKEETGLTFFTLMISSLNSLVLPELMTATFTSPDSDEAKGFLVRAISNFSPFKKAILLFENRPYTIGEFEKIGLDWQMSLKEIK
jgi:hypothetical protein